MSGESKFAGKLRSGDVPPGEFVEWDVLNWSRALAFWQHRLETYGKRDLTDRAVLEVGARDGGLSLWFALEGACVTSTDLTGPTQVARLRHQRFGVADRINYAALDATNIDEHDKYDIVVFKSVLGGIGHDGSLERQLKALDEMWAALRPGGVLLFAENLVASPLHRLARRMFVKWGQRWRYPTHTEILSGMTRFSEVATCSFGFLGAFGRTESQRAFLGRLDRLGIDRMVPAAWRYILAVAAQK